MTLVNIGSGNGLLADVTKPLPALMIFYGIHMRAILKMSIPATSLQNEFENHTFEITAISPRDQRVNKYWRYELLNKNKN